jgi:hypothetical protein
VPNHYLEHFFFMWILSAQGSDLAPIFGDWSCSENFSQLKPPLKGEKEITSVSQ